MYIIISIILFFILSPGILFRITKSKWGAFIHGIIFATILSFVYDFKYSENMIPLPIPLTVYTTSKCSNEDIVTNTRKAIKQNLYFKAGPKNAPVCRGPFLFEKPETED
jgi:hypothetical protein